MNFRLEISQQSKPAPEYHNGGFLTDESELQAGKCRCRCCGELQENNPLKECFWCKHPLWPIMRVRRTREHFLKIFKDFQLEALLRLPSSSTFISFNPEQFSSWEINNRSYAIRKLISERRYFNQKNLDALK